MEDPTGREPGEPPVVSLISHLSLKSPVLPPYVYS